ncbi:unnamed protein product [Clavelina lepadiformis]|uniref:Uncharacterized protein n=1 Tax=Clavelina lepadiformis TaxID=159417 RepID=A0ABP0G648_CLALP
MAEAYGYKSIDVCLHEFTCKFQFTFASTDIPHPILGADFLKRFNLLVDQFVGRLTSEASALLNLTRPG